ncbi:Fic family protein [Amycolatopsis jejuensis]|uniref:Fic family protein n=1 Tax=Amycolatopsis jejuensis TaxID=330084 RepID=UPI00068EDA45|nr:Fic/DOC family N-terminal domain-containing protein [Amycolatopsis jejuensis]
MVPDPLPREVDLSALTDQLPNPDLLVQPSLTREAISTSALEGTFAPYADVLQAQRTSGPAATAEIREIQNYVRRGDAYDGDLLRDGVSDWEKWINADQEMPVLVKLVLNLSSWLEPRREDCLGHVLNVSKTGNFDPWVRFFAEAVKARAHAAGNTIGRLTAFSKEVIQTMRNGGARGAVHDLAVKIIGYPMMTIPEVQDNLSVSYPTASTAIKKLEEAGFLRELTAQEPAPPTRRMIFARIADTMSQKTAAMP